MDIFHSAEHLTHGVDPITVSTELRKYQFITKSQHKHILHLFNKNQSRQEIWNQLLYFIGQTCNVSDVLKVFERTCYNHIALKLLMQYILSKRSPICTNIQRIGNQSSSRQFSQRLLVNLKKTTNNILFHDPREFLGSLSHRFKIKFETESNELLKTQKADKYAAVLCAEIDSQAILYKKESPKHRSYDELKRIIPYTSNYHTTNAAYNSRMGIAYAIAEDLEKADDYLKDSRVSSHNIEQCVEIDNMMYIHVFNLLCEYEKNPTIDTKRRILEIADTGLKCLENDEDDIRAFWKRMFFLRKVFCYLGLGYMGDPIVMSVVTEECLLKSKKLLAEIDRSFDTMYARRKMWYYAARARINELESNFDSATTYINKPISIGTDGKFGELTNINAYANNIAAKLRCCYTEATESFDSSPMGMIVLNEEDQSNEETSLKIC